MLLLHVNAQLWGLLIGAPAAHFWHAYLQKWFARKADTFDTAIQKVTHPQLHSPLAAAQRSSEACVSQQAARPPLWLLRQLWVTVLLLQVVLDQLTFGPAYNLAFMAYTSMVVHSECGATGVEVPDQRNSVFCVGRLHAGLVC